jgi:predicted AAA+ superfamily ATPase
MVKRTMQPVIAALAKRYPVVTVTGPRQSGKTTLCRAVFPDKPYVNLESPDLRRFARLDPRGFLSQYPKGAILDEVQRTPELLSYLQTVVDERPRPGMFILTGSQQFEVMNSVGRTALLKLLPFSLEELHARQRSLPVDRLILTGFYPRIHDRKLDPTQALGDYLETYVERDLRQIQAIKDLGLFDTFLRLCAGRVGQLLNLQSLGNDAGISHNWISLLEASYIVHLLRPWHGNLAKRQVKSPKLYFYDVGLAAYLLGIESERHVSRHPLRGNLFENMVVSEALKFRFHRGKRSNLFFWRDAKGREIDLLLEQGADLVPVEVKAGATVNEDFFGSLRYLAQRLPGRTRRGLLIYGGTERQERSDATVAPVWDLPKDLRRSDGE